ncbi:MAG: cysteine desulfurase [Clostridiales Family XIII bacterium]|jgi:cysteine desulfurase|nr:cysteine desulfurase [Clostridiales Family XIII bacterium]
MLVYLDNASTTKPCEAAIAASLDALSACYGNPSSAHTLGQEAERLVKRSRADIAALLGAREGQLVFTGSGTESDNIAFHSVFKNPARISGRRLIISGIEHPAVARPAAYYAEQGAELAVMPVSTTGMVDTEAIEDALGTAAAAQRTSLISVMHVNSEIGTIQPIAEIAHVKDRINKRYGAAIALHTDAVQSFGKLPIMAGQGAADAGSAGHGVPGAADAGSRLYSDFSGVDLISISAHKIHGPKGVGALYAKRPEKLGALIRGGGQEGGHRSGTENTAGIAGFAAAANDIRVSGDDGLIASTESDTGQSAAHRVAGLRARLLQGIKDAIADVRINSPEKASADGEPGCCSPYILNVSFLGARGEVILHELEGQGVFVSTGSACSNLGKKGGASKMDHTLAAIGLRLKEAEGALRFSLSRYSTEQEIDHALEHLTAAVKRIRSIGAYR